MKLSMCAFSFGLPGRMNDNGTPLRLGPICRAFNRRIPPLSDGNRLWQTARIGEGVE